MKSQNFDPTEPVYPHKVINLGPKSLARVVDATLVTRLKAVSATVSAGGSGYSVGDVLTVVGGTGTAATFTVASLSTTAVATVTLLTGGLYSAIPSNAAATTAAPAGGTSATLTVAYGVASVVVSAAGSGNTAAPTVALSGGAGSGAALGTVTLDASGGIASVAVTTAGTGYTSLPTVGITHTNPTVVFSTIQVKRGTFVHVKAMVRAFQPSTGNSGFYELSAVAHNNAGTTALVGTVSKVAFEDASDWDVAITANDTNDTLDFTLTGDLSAATKVEGLASVFKGSLTA